MQTHSIRPPDYIHRVYKDLRLNLEVLLEQQLWLCHILVQSRLLIMFTALLTTSSRATH